jgi:hypothetical protein
MADITVSPAGGGSGSLPAKGTFTDGLLVKGTNTNAYGDPNWAPAGFVQAYDDHLITNPGYPNIVTFNAGLHLQQGQNCYGYDPNGTWTQAKLTSGASVMEPFGLVLGSIFYILLVVGALLCLTRF